MEYSPVSFKHNIDKNSFKIKKFYGQNFISDENVINKIVDKSEIDKDTLVIEIGPGIGSLTYKLAKKAGFVMCYEIDETLKPLLFENMKNVDNFKVNFIDFLKCDVNNDLKEYNYKKLYVVANLPYYITTPIILKIIEDRVNVDKIVVMVQKEVGDRFKAMPNTKDYGSLSVYLNYYYNIKKLMDVSRNIFVPIPNVDSIVVEFTKNENKYILNNEDLFFKLVRDSFKQKRKTLKNNLKSYDLDKINEVLSKYNMDLSVRAEQLPIDIFVDIANNL